MHDVMSITKAALGLVYTHEGVDTTLPLWPGWKDSDLRLEDALHHRAGMHDEGGKFDYWGFRRALRGDVTQYAVAKLERVKGSRGEFGYSNLAWQLLAFRFEEVTGISPTVALERLLGNTGWTWEKDETGTCLGPHGLLMTPQAARKLGEAAMWYYTAGDFKVLTPRWFWKDESLPENRYVHNGWFAYKSPSLEGFATNFFRYARNGSLLTQETSFVMYASGFLNQYIVVAGQKVYVQLRGARRQQFDRQSITAREDRFLQGVIDHSI